MAARRTAAAAVLANYQREALTADVYDRAMWGARLADMLAIVLAAVHVEPAPGEGAVTGPFETEGEARSAPEVRAAYEAAHSSPRRGVMTEHNHRMLCEAAEAAGAVLGAYDHRILSWLAGYEPRPAP